jgi:DNA-binding MurR/RpiR family transcriptional regulator
MKKSIIDISKYDSLTNVEKYALEYILNNLEKIKKMKIVEVALSANVSIATISRLIKKLGYEGFSEFKYIAFKQEEIKSEEKDSIDYILEKNINEIKNTIKNQNNNDLIKICKNIENAKNIFIISRGLSKFVAHEIQLKFSLLNKNCMMYNDANIIKKIYNNITLNDIVIFVSLNGETEELVYLAKQLKASNIKTLLLTTNSDSSLSKLISNKLIGVSLEQPFLGEFEVKSRLSLSCLARILIDYYLLTISN